jgi:Zn-dependent protease/predicted transcriptional regulator
MESSFKLGRIRGIEIGIHYTWLFAFALVAWSLAGGFFPANYPGWGVATYWIVGIVAALALFASVLVHELSHSFVALARGHGVHSITLFIFGGVSNLSSEAEEPKDEFLISIVGPLTSFAIAAVCWLVAQALPSGNSPLSAVLSYLALINVMLGVFNLLPGFPLDGGRVLRSIIWAATGSLRRATDIASYVGQGFGFLLIFWGVAQVLGGNFLGGLWIGFIGWFLNSAAESTRQQQVVQEGLRGARVAEVMNPQPPIASPTMSVQEFVFDHVVRQGQRALLVVDGGRLLGIVSITDAKELSQEAWPTTRVDKIMTPTPLKTVSPDTDVNSALQLLVEGSLNQVPVVQDDHVVGLLSRVDIVRFLQLREELGLRRSPAGGSTRPRSEPAR